MWFFFHFAMNTTVLLCLHKAMSFIHTSHCMATHCYNVCLEKQHPESMHSCENTAEGNRHFLECENEHPLL